MELSLPLFVGLQHAPHIQLEEAYNPSHDVPVHKGNKLHDDQGVAGLRFFVDWHPSDRDAPALLRRD
jgi:hypothetical protein